MIGALNHAATAIQELVYNPFEWNTQMRAAILVEINLIPLFDREQPSSGQVETHAASLGNVSKAAEALPIG